MAHSLGGLVVYSRKKLFRRFFTWVYLLLWMHERTDFLTIHDLLKVAFLVHIEDIDR